MTVTPRAHNGGMAHHAYVDVPHVTGCKDCGQDANAPVHGAPIADDAEITALLFADYARKLGAVCHDLALAVPSFRGVPAPDEDGQCRWIRRYPAGATVTVVLRGRPAGDVKRDMVDGACEANRLHHDHPKRWQMHDLMEGA